MSGDDLRSNVEETLEGKEAREGPLIKPAYSVKRQNRYFSSAIACARCICMCPFGLRIPIVLCGQPRGPFTSGPDSRSYRKSALRGMAQVSERARAKGQGKGRESEKRLSKPAVWRRVPGGEG